MEVLLFRHGNTFHEGETPYFCGKNEDLPLVPRGEEQALEAAATLKSLGWLPDVAFASPLTRSRRFAQVIIEETSPPVEIQVDADLSEIDYGAWGGLSDSEIIARGQGPLLEQWREAGEFPRGTFGETREQCSMRIARFFTRLQASSAAERVLVVTSNGILKVLRSMPDCGVLELPAAAPFADSASVKTGHLCFLVAAEGGRFMVRDWNVAPLDWKPSQVRVQLSSGELHGAR